MLRSHEQLREVVLSAPPGFGSKPVQYRYDVIFLKAPLTAAAAIGSVPTRSGVDEVHAGTGVLYFRRLVSQASQSRPQQIVTLPLYQSVTIRNWNTTSKLLKMMDETKAVPA